MEWKKILFGDYNYTKTSDDGKEKLSISLKGGLLPSLFIWGGITALIWFLFFR